MVNSTHLVDYPIPGKPSIIHDDMNLATAKLSSFLHQLTDITPVGDITNNSQGTAGFRGVDGVSDCIGFLYSDS